MKKLDKNAYSENRHDKSHLMILGLIIFIISLAMLIGGVALIIRGVIIAKVSAIIWRAIVGGVLSLLGLTFAWVAIMVMVTAATMIKVKDGNVSDVGNSAVGTVNINKCPNCGTKLDEDAEFCTNCGAQIDGYIKCECGCKNSLDANNCKKCGKALK